MVALLAATCVIFFAARALSPGVVVWWAQAVRLANFAFLLALHASLNGARAVRRCELAVLVATSGSLGCSALVCTLEGDSINAGLATVAVTLGTASFVPWSMRRQLVLVLISTVAVATNALALGSYARPTETITITTALLTFGATVWMTHTLEEARRRSAVDELLRRRAEAELREANDALEQRVHERTAKMREAVEELQAFNYSVSHDLRSPLRTIDGMSRLIEEEYASRLDAAAIRYLGRVKKAAGRMGQLIDALLARSRVGQAELRVVPVDMCSLADTVIADLRATEPSRQVSWSRPSVLIASADRTLVAVVLQHLLGNAWKFTREVPDARIELGLGAEGYVVRDNGVGFRMDHAGKLFENFQRLHGEEYEGTGIGLATVRRIVARHGGTVRIQSAPGEGTAAYFTLGESARACDPSRTK